VGQPFTCEGLLMAWNKAGALILGLLCLLMGQAVAADRLLVLTPSMQEIYLGRYLEILRDPDHKLTFDDLRDPGQQHSYFQVDKDIPNFGFFDRSAYWAKLTIKNPSPEPIAVYLVSNYAPLDYASVSWQLADGQWTSLTLGDQVPFHMRPIKNRLPIFPLSINPGVSTLYFRVSSFSSVQFPFVLSTPTHFIAYQAKDHLILGGLLATCIVMLFYNFFVYLHFHSRAYLFYVIYIFSYLIFSLFFQGLIPMVFLPDAAKSSFINIGQIFIIDVCVISVIYFASEFLGLKTRAPRMHRILSAWKWICVLNLINHLTLQKFAIPLTMFNNIAVALLLLGTGLHVAREFKPARFFIMAWVFMLVGTIVQILASGGIVPINTFTIWSQAIGATVEMILLSFALGDRVSLISKDRELALQQRAKIQEELANTQESLLHEREDHIRSLDRIVDERTRDIRSILTSINQGIFTVGIRDGRLSIASEHSQFLLSLLHAPNLSDHDPISRIFARFELNTDRLDQIRNVLLNVIGDPALTFDLNDGLLPHELYMKQAEGHGLSVFEVDWTPILDSEDRVEKMLVSIRDVTQIRKLREVSEARQLELVMTSELVSQQGHRFPKLKSACQIKHAFLLGRIQEPQVNIEDLKNEVLIFLHTLKGEARVCGFAILAQVAHEAEDALVGTEAVTAALLLEQLQGMALILEHYTEVYIEKLGRRDDSDTGVVANSRDLEQVMADFDRMIHQEDRWQTSPFATIYGHFNRILGLELPSILQVHILDLEKSSRQLGKSAPYVLFKGPSIRIPRQYHEKLSEVFGHILRNSVDHGLESKQERSEAGKPLAGTITFTQEKHAGQLSILYRDDGRGLDLLAIAEKAGRLGLLNRHVDSLDPGEVASCILLPQLSTRAEVSKTAGRGIGLSAAQHLLRDLGGDIKVLLGPPKDRDARFYSFEFQITFPLTDGQGENSAKVNRQTG
jgi:HPt (histidine-containing phosphotransfer) domain-containing protein